MKILKNDDNFKRDSPNVVQNRITSDYRYELNCLFCPSFPTCHLQQRTNRGAKYVRIFIF